MMPMLSSANQAALRTVSIEVLDQKRLARRPQTTTEVRRRSKRFDSGAPPPAITEVEMQIVPADGPTCNPHRFVQQLDEFHTILLGEQKLCA